MLHYFCFIWYKIDVVTKAPHEFFGKRSSKGEEDLAGEMVGFVMH